MKKILAKLEKGVLISFKAGPVFHIISKDSKESLKIETITTTGLTGKPDGILGVSIRPHQYQIVEDGVILVGGEVITNAVRTWTEHAFCHILPPQEVHKFLGHSMASYIVGDLLGESPPSWYAKFAEENSPK